MVWTPGPPGKVPEAQVLRSDPHPENDRRTELDAVESAVRDAPLLPITARCHI